MIRDEWLSYLAEVVPGDADAVQKTECRRAFYAGALVAVVSLNERGTTTRAIFDECMAFKDKVKREGDSY